MMRGLLAQATLVAITAQDYDQAAALDRTCRRNGETVRNLIDCLIAAVAIRSNEPVFHADTDFAAPGPTHHHRARRLSQVAIETAHNTAGPARVTVHTCGTKSPVVEWREWAPTPESRSRTWKRLRDEALEQAISQPPEAKKMKR